MTVVEYAVLRFTVNLCTAMKFLCERCTVFVCCSVFNIHHISGLLLKQNVLVPVYINYSNRTVIMMIYTLQINELQKQLHRKDQELSRHLEEEKVLHHNFGEAVGEGNKFREFLIVRVFRKKIKRAKKKSQETEGTVLHII